MSNAKIKIKKHNYFRFCKMSQIFFIYSCRIIKNTTIKVQGFINYYIIIYYIY